MKIGIVSRLDRKDALELAKLAIDFLAGRAVKLEFESSLAAKLGLRGVALENFKADLVLVIGGDGTILRTLQKCSKPVLGVKVGAVGFLAEAEPAQLFKALEKVLAGRYRIEARIKLKTVLNKELLPDATNEVVLHTARVAKICQFKIKFNSTSQELTGDGLIVATPTGSTSYALSVGSPILDQKVKAFVLAPIAPFRFATRPLVVATESKIEVSLSKGKEWVLVIDGQYERKLKEKDRVKLGLAERAAQFVRLR